MELRSPLIRFRGLLFKEVNPTYHNCSKRHFEVLCFRENKVDILFEFSAKQTIHMKCQVLFSLKNKINFRMSSASICIVLYGLTGHTNHRNTGILPKYQNTREKYRYTCERHLLKTPILALINQLSNIMSI